MRFAVLDSWRGLAALIVALHHFNAFGYFYDLGLIRNAYLFVDFFFVLSGFVIAHAYYSRLSGPKNLGPFMVRRFGRVWPLHAFMLALFVAFPLAEWAGCRATRLCGVQWPFDSEHGLATIVSNLLLIQSLGIYDHLSWNWPSWSISTEFYTYLLFALVCISARTVIILIAVGAILASAAIVALLAPEGMNTTYDYGYFRCVMGFFAGFLVLRWCQARPIAMSNREATALEIISVLIVLAFVSLVGKSRVAMFAPLIFSLCVFVFSHEAGSLSRLLRTPFMLKLGERSYSIYMVHAFLLIVLLRVVSAIEKFSGTGLRIDVGRPAKLYYIGDRLLMDGAAVVYLLTVIALASLSYRFVESVARRAFNRWAQALEDRRLGAT